MNFSSYEEFFRRVKHRGPVLLGVLALVIIAAIATPIFFGKKEHAAQPTQAPAVPVTVAQAVQESVPLQISAIGTVEAYSKVNITSEANGQLTKVYFTEGQYVKKGDPLFTIDPRTSQAELSGAVANQSRAVGQQRQAEANMAKDMAQAKTAEVTAQRYGTLYKEGIVSKEQYDQARTTADALAAVVKADQAAIASERESVSAAGAATEAARVQLGFTQIRAPVSGRTGSLMIHAGNVIKANDSNPLVVINQTKPIYVSFAVPETQLPDIKRYMAQGTLQVAAVIPNDNGAPEQGTLTFVDNAVDTATGTVKLKATFANDQQRLWPGQFVNVALTLATEPNAIVVPSAAVQTGQEGRYVFAVKPDQTVEMRTVEVQRTAGEKSIIARGLSAGETVVTDGQLRLRPGSKIRVADNKAKPSQPQEHP
jgi:multidrug efflux system membrane fusion protein